VPVRCVVELYDERTLSLARAAARGFRRGSEVAFAPVFGESHDLLQFDAAMEQFGRCVRAQDTVNKAVLRARRGMAAFLGQTPDQDTQSACGNPAEQGRAVPLLRKGK